MKATAEPRSMRASRFFAATGGGVTGVQEQVGFDGSRG